ncbi:MAG: hypothetical protein ABI672_08070 [Vicinamibacteria bacterium]
MKSLLLAMAVAGGAVLAVQPPIEQALTAMGPEPDAHSVWTGPVVRSLSVGFSDVLADLYWLRAVQCYGRQKIDGTYGSFADLEPLLQTAAALDPRFEMVYRYGAVFLSEPTPVGAGKPKAGVALLKQGADANPLNWRLRQEEGLFTFFYLNDPLGAAEILKSASLIPDAPFWMNSLAAQILSNGGEIEAALQMWTILYERSEPGLLRDNAASQVRVAQNRLLAKRLQEKVKAYREKSGDQTSSLERLKELGVIETFVDLVGVPFEFDAAQGVVRVSRESSLWRR